ncbi:hypothetical protein PFICI_15047 [Pestalotiopsis fici W106-1]|uniref:Glutamine amidotransferase domain-containing protein n=1 Tax=Pestalotiopsis fici (strain W106-1 / CGMCC3.15140) TaxID=1229662 RepID=W3WJW7_PESFW|nr:uncharacterized protein PFICI_15047 [Pestalotiopsis fici W106-1]ETS73442.1 hypothetical protein PFICI_15047 [Pestalotiopsis fici W106-1]
MVSKTPTLKIAIVRNYDTPATWGQLMIDSFSNTIKSIVPGAAIETFFPITNGVFPDIDGFDLIILTGGTVNLTLPEVEPWVENTFDFIRTVSQSSSTKLMGICWGHQAICRALGGTIRFNSQGDCVGVNSLKFTDNGIEFFGKSKSGEQSREFSLHKFHKRQIDKIAPNFIELAEDREVLLSKDDKIISFQGHPEMTREVARGILDADDGAYTGELTQGQVDDLYALFELQNDGLRIFGRVLDWCSEKEPTRST